MDDALPFGMEFTEYPYDGNVIVDLTTDIYKTMISLAIMSPSDIAFAPPEGHRLILSEVPNVDRRISPRVVSLLRRLPLPANLRVLETFELVPGTCPTRYLNEGGIYQSRDIDHVNYDYKTLESLDLDNILPQDVVLTFQVDTNVGYAMVLDVEQSMFGLIRSIVLRIFH